MEFSKNPLVSWLIKSRDWVKSNKALAISIFAGLVLFGSLLVGYSFYKSGLQKKAHTDFLEALKILDAKVLAGASDSDLQSGNVFDSEEKKLSEVAKVFHQAFEKNKNAGIAPFFLAHEIKALVLLGKGSEAIAAQELLLKTLPARSRLVDYNKIKLALMKISFDDVESGLSSLREVAQNPASCARDEALYNLGQYYYSKEDYKQAINFWNKLDMEFGSGSKQPSWRVDSAKKKLKTIKA